MRPSSIGIIVHILHFRLWKRLGLQRPHLREGLRQLLSETHPCAVILNPRTAEPKPVPYEIEMGLEAVNR